MKGWVTLSLATLLCWGLWGFLGKLGGRTLSPGHLLLVTYTGMVLIFPMVLWLYGDGFRVDGGAPDQWYALVAGLVCGLGFPLFYLALSGGEVSKVVVITATYPVVTVLLAAWFLSEPLTIKTALGTVLAIIGIVLLST
jgi:transporter family protein